MSTVIQLTEAQAKDVALDYVSHLEERGFVELYKAFVRDHFHTVDHVGTVTKIARLVERECNLPKGFIKEEL